MKPLAVLIILLLQAAALQAEAIGWRYLGTYELRGGDCIIFKSYERGYMHVEIRRCTDANSIAFQDFPRGRIKLVPERGSFHGGIEIVVAGDGSIPFPASTGRFSIYFKPDDPVWGFDAHMNRIMSWSDPRTLVRDLTVMTRGLFAYTIIAAVMVWIAVRSRSPAVIATGALAVTIIASVIFGIDLRFALVMSAVLLAYALYRMLWRSMT